MRFNESLKINVFVLLLFIITKADLGTQAYIETLFKLYLIIEYMVLLDVIHGVIYYI